MNHHIIDIICATVATTATFFSFSACANEPSADDHSGSQTQIDEDVHAKCAKDLSSHLECFKEKLSMALTCECSRFEGDSDAQRDRYEDDIEQFINALGIAVDAATDGQRSATIKCADGDCAQLIESLDRYAPDTETALRFGIDSMKQIRDNQAVTREDLLVEELDAFFNSDALSAQEKLAIYIELLPELIAHASMSDATITARNLYASYQSLRRAPNAQSLRIVCRQTDEEKIIDIAFDFDVLKNETAAYDSHVELYCPEPEPLPIATVSTPAPDMPIGNGASNVASSTPATAIAINEIPAESDSSTTATAIAIHEIPTESDSSTTATAIAIHEIPVEIASSTPSSQTPSTISDEHAVVGDSEPLSVAQAQKCTPRPDTAQNAIICRSTTIPYRSKTDFGLIESQLAMALRTKDNAAISRGLIELSQALESLANRFEHLPDDAFCTVFGIYLVALSQDRFAELHSVEQQLKRIYRNNFVDRLIKYKSCTADSNPTIAAQAQSLWENDGELYTWITTHFRGKARQKLDKTFRQWTKPRKLAITQPRRMIAAWTAWTLGDYERAYRFSEGMTNKKPRIVHPQIHAFDTMLKLSNSIPIDRESLESYIRTTMLKTPSLPYQSFTAVAGIVGESDKKLIAQAMQSYSPAIAPTAAAQFFVAYSDAFEANLTPKQIVEIGTWIDTELSASESPCTTTKRRLAWVAQAAQIGDFATIAKRSQYFSASPTALPATSQLWQQIACIAQSPNEADIVESCQKAHPSRPSYDECQTEKGTSVDDYWRHIAICW
ncbi:MAG: hypothetical protein KIG72_11505 [Bradymonadales bacterium]|nr:hypothetical protein [Bradymonadales bacterium]